MAKLTLAALVAVVTVTLLTGCGEPVDLEQLDREHYAALAKQRDICEDAGGRFMYDPEWLPQYTCRFDSTSP